MVPVGQIKSKENIYKMKVITINTFTWQGVDVYINRGNQGVETSSTAAVSVGPQKICFSTTVEVRCSFFKILHNNLHVALAIESNQRALGSHPLQSSIRDPILDRL